MSEHSKVREMGVRAREDGVGAEDGYLQGQTITDTGYAWVIAIAGFMTFAIYGAFMRCEGIYYGMFMSRYGGSAQITAWLGAMASTVHSFSAPLSTMLINRFSVRTSVLLAACISSLGYLSTAYATSIYWQFFTYSILQGLARSLAMTPAFACVSMYFDKRRGQVLAFTISGAAFGALLIIPLTQWLVDVYQFQGTFLILSGVALNGLVCGLLFRPFSLHQKFCKTNIMSPSTGSSTETQKLIPKSELATHRPNSKDHKPNPTHGENENLLKAVKATEDHFNNQGKLPKLCGCHQACSRKTNMYRSVLDSDTDNNDNEMKSPGNKNGFQRLRFVKEFSDYTDTEPCEGCDGRDEKSLIEILRACAKCCLGVFTPCFAVDNYDKNHETKSKIFHFSIFRHSPFMLICLSVVFYKLGNKTLLDFLPPMSEEQGLSQVQLSGLLSVVQVTDMAGKLLIGYAMDTETLRPHLEFISALTLFLLAALSLSVPILCDFHVFCLVIGVYSLLSGASTIQRTLVVSRMVDPDVLSSCFGVLYGFQGLGTLIGPPMAGALKDIYGSYRWTSVFTGASLVLSACLDALSSLIPIDNKTSTPDPEVDGAFSWNTSCQFDPYTCWRLVTPHRLCAHACCLGSRSRDDDVDEIPPVSTEREVKGVKRCKSKDRDLEHEPLIGDENRGR